MIVKPFRAWRPPAELAAVVASPPYDVLSSAEARRLAAGEPRSFLHVTKPEIDLDPATDPYADAVYATGARNFRAMIERGWLVRDERASYYVYRLTMDGRAQTGLLGAAGVDDYRTGRIKRHEHTRPEKEKDRVRLNDAIGAHPGPVFLAYRGLPELNAIVNGVVADGPRTDFAADDGVRHEVWVVDEPATCRKIETLFRHVPATYVADGHHRAAAAVKVAELRDSRQPPGASADRESAWRFFMAAHFPYRQLRVLDYNRVVRDLNGMEPATFLDRLARRGFHVGADHRKRRPPSPETFGMYLDRRWYLLTPRPELIPTDVVGKLDVAILNDQVLSPLLGIGDPRTDRRVEFVGGIRGMDELERLVDSGDYEVAFAVHPTSLEHVMAVADAGRVLPPKSTWFEPKLRSGLIVQSFDEGL
ncbi:MAG TPA: DUF1015 family protein [Candidatus Polarisedimenticolaceae bacterium]|nr:DUF1015 family protein [Candidatus Polarisedimenticolaceae bacterium]